MCMAGVGHVRLSGAKVVRDWSGFAIISRFIYMLQDPIGFLKTYVFMFYHAHCYCAVVTLEDSLCSSYVLCKTLLASCRLLILLVSSYVL